VIEGPTWADAGGPLGGSEAGAPTRGRFEDRWRRAKSAAFDLGTNSTGRRTVDLDLWGRSHRVYANANLSIYSARSCNARCPFCVEELRPASRGLELAGQKRIETEDEPYFAALSEVLRAVSPLDPSVSVTGGEASKDPRLPRILRTLADHGCRKRTLTTNGSGLLDEREGRAVVDWIGGTGLAHLNISVAHPDPVTNARIMAFREGLSPADLCRVVARAASFGTRVRLSCVLLRGAIDSVDGVEAYLDFARAMGVDNVIFRQLMLTDPVTVVPNHVVRYSDRRRVALEPILDAVSARRGFEFRRQVMGYYYYVEVWRWRGVDVVFEEADLARLEAVKGTEARAGRPTVHELIFHPDAHLASTWQPWDGVLGPPNDGVEP
jgi:molybdenum cofactor biosynthesis enzyme MoaA